MKRPAAVAVAVSLLLCGLLAGCGSSQDPAAWLEDCERKTREYAAGTGYLHFVQEIENSLVTPQVGFVQVVRIEGDIIFPDREAYEHKENVSSTLRPELSYENDFSYLTTDRGATAYVMGEKLSEQLGVFGWIHYTPTAEQDQYFDPPALITSLVDMAAEPEWVGLEEMDGESCAHVRYSASGRELLDLRIQQDPAFAAQFQGSDLDQIAGEVTVDIWIGKADRLPRRMSVEQEATLEQGASSVTRMDFYLRAYGQEPPLSIEAPASAHEAA